MWLALYCAMALKSTAYLRAEDLEAQAQVTNSAPSLSLEVQYTSYGVNNRSRHVLVFAGAERYSFFVPEDYRPEIAMDNQVQLISKDATAFIVVTFEPTTVDGVPSAESLKAKILSRHAEVVINKEETLWLNQKASPAVDFTWKTAQGFTRVSRELVSSSPIGLVRINFTASPDKFQSGLNDLDQVMITFSPGKNGRFGFVTASKWP